MTRTPDPTADRLLRRAAERAAAHPFYLAHALNAYREAERLGEPELAGWLGCAEDDMPRLALCRRPGILFPPEAPEHEEELMRDVILLADRFGLHAERLASLLRRTAFLDAAAQPLAEDAPGGLLMAARDREEEPPSETDGEEAPE